MNIYLLLLYSLGLVPIAMGLLELKRCVKQKSWKEAEGRITQSEVIRPQVGSRNLPTPHICYEYFIDSKKYSSNQINQGNFTLGVKSVLLRYPYNCKVKVFYNPNHPEQSVLERQVTMGTYFLLAIGISWLCAISYGLKHWN